ncbi:MAG: precorrin-6B methylase [Eubacterium sp.]|nr:precorrin-6B methylase [Eubacterium sp.]
MTDTTSIFTNEHILAWLSYFSKEADLNLEKVKIMDISIKNKNVIPTVESNKRVLIFADAGYPNFFYDLWAAGLGECDIWFKTGQMPEGSVSRTKIRNCINIELDGPCVMLIINTAAKSPYKIGIRNDNFSNGPIRYVGNEIRAVIMSMLHVDTQDTICIISGESIAVEAAMIASEGTILSVEYEKGDRETMEENVVKFGLHNVEIIPDATEKTLQNYPVPSLAFIVASKHLEEEIRQLLAVNPKCKFIIYTLELNILSAVPELFKKYNIQNQEILQIAISKLNKKNVFESQPVPWLISGEPV